jgi:hypothetical protein
MDLNTARTGAHSSHRTLASFGAGDFAAELAAASPVFELGAVAPGLEPGLERPAHVPIEGPVAALGAPPGQPSTYAGKSSRTLTQQIDQLHWQLA